MAGLAPLIDAPLIDSWPAGAWSSPQRNYFCALLQLTGKPSVAKQMMEELELWKDDRRPPKGVLDEWTHRWRLGASTIKPKLLAQIQKQYDAFRRGDLDQSLRVANLAHRTISQTVIDGKFDKDTSGALQHLGQFVAIGTEKRQQTFEPRLRDQAGIQIAPAFFLSAPPERQKQLSDPNIIEAEAREVG